MAVQASPGKLKELRLPISRVRTIMKSSPYVEAIGQDGLFLVTKATELFIHYLTEEAHSQSKKGHNLDYKHLAEVVQSNDCLEFLREIMPRKITVRQFKQMMAAKNAVSSSDSDSDSQSDSSSSSDSDEENSDDSSEANEDTNKANGKSESSDKSENSNSSDSDEDNKMSTES
ncbi:chromatin accessibility complex 16kD protein-like [Leptopilina boulardi]|uniref:chromatin accessibility complex 16kD protein-like n=1 Tax=Leptopilina boulardi TaxID=63433 RepID=UPI0021F68A64|nr:chromatin accessibility complex 16kD protein-like [Leptopilina boulardi]